MAHGGKGYLLRGRRCACAAARRAGAGGGLAEPAAGRAVRRRHGTRSGSGAYDHVGRLTEEHDLTEPTGAPATPAVTAPGALPPGAAPDARPDPGERPPRRLLERPPSERLAAAADLRRGATAATTGSPARAFLAGIVAATGGAMVHLAAAILLLWTGGLLVVATTVGIVVGLAVARGGGPAIRPRSRRALALVLALRALVVAIGLDWGLSGRYLVPLDYLAQVYGALVPLELGLAAAGALAGSRGARAHDAVSRVPPGRRDASLVCPGSTEPPS